MAAVDPSLIDMKTRLPLGQHFITLLNATPVTPATDHIATHQLRNLAAVGSMEQATTGMGFVINNSATGDGTVLLDGAGSGKRSGGVIGR